METVEVTLTTDATTITNLSMIAVTTMIFTVITAGPIKCIVIEGSGVITTTGPYLLPHITEMNEIGAGRITATPPTTNATRRLAITTKTIIIIMGLGIGLRKRPTGTIQKDHHQRSPETQCSN